MYNLFLALGASLLAFLGFSFLVGGGDFRPLYGLVPALFVLGGVYVYLAKRTLKEMEALMNRAQVPLQKLQQSGRPTQGEQERAIGEAVQILKEGYVWDRWQFWSKSQLDGQIGQLLYMVKKFPQSEKYLSNSLKRNWLAQAMLGALHYKKDKIDEMVEVFDAAVKVNKKESLLWNMYAYCLSQKNRQDEAIAILNKALEHMPKDEKTRTNLEALQNNKKMQMRPWNMAWYQFHLETPPAQRAPSPQQAMNGRRRRR